MDLSCLNHIYSMFDLLRLTEIDSALLKMIISIEAKTENNNDRYLDILTVSCAQTKIKDCSENKKIGHPTVISCEASSYQTFSSQNMGLSFPSFQTASHSL